MERIRNLLLTGGAGSRDYHLQEFACLAQNKQQGDVENAVERLKERDYRIRWHTWDQSTFMKDSQNTTQLAVGMNGLRGFGGSNPHVQSFPWIKPRSLLRGN